MIENFREEVASALPHIYDLAFLELSPLASLDAVADGMEDTRALTLQRMLFDAIEALCPLESTPTDDLAHRPYSILKGRYVRGHSHIALQAKLGLSQSQFYREHARAIDALAGILARSLGIADQTPKLPIPSANGREAVLLELSKMMQQEPIQIVDVESLLEEVTSILASMSESKKVSLRTTANGRRMWVCAVPSILRQGLFVALAKVWDTLAEGVLEVTVCHHRDRVSIALTRRGTQQTVSRPNDQSLLQSCIEMVGGNIAYAEDTSSLVDCITLPTVRSGGIVLLVDNNLDLGELFSRYLDEEPWSLVQATSVNQALDFCKKHLPVLILLDILMPHQSGWQFLAHLRSFPRLSQIPVVICSILDEPSLSSSLGAQGHMSKPVTRDHLLECLRYWARL